MRIFGKVTAEFTVDEAAHINALLERDEAKPAKKDGAWVRCPICNKLLSKDDLFCDRCGQRIDLDNTAL